MSKRRKHRKGRRKDRASGVVARPRALVEYYQPAFAKYHLDPAFERLRPGHHRLRHSFWDLVPPGNYWADSASELLTAYLKRLEAALEGCLTDKSLAYCLHVYRRLFPGPIGENREAATIHLTRATLEAAFHKYCSRELCRRIGISTEVPPGSILRGFLSVPPYRFFLDALARAPSFVLTDFGPEDLVEFYEMEKLAYEVWSCTAMLRTVGKGGYLAVGNMPNSVGVVIDDDLGELLRRFDERSGLAGVSGAGVVFDHPRSVDGYVLIPSYNIREAKTREIVPLLNLFGADLQLPKNWSPEEQEQHRPNFVWGTFNLRSFYSGHRAFAEPFETKYSCDLLSALVVPAATTGFLLDKWQAHAGSIWRDWQRAYLEPKGKSRWLKILDHFVDFGISVLGMDVKKTSIDLEAAFEFWCLRDSDRVSIDVSVPGPHALFVPFGEEAWVLDLAWLGRRLYYLFNLLAVEDGNFKGSALESAIQTPNPPLPQTQLRARDGSRKQIDGAFSAGSTLIIAECRAFGWSLGMERGRPDAIAFRRAKITDLLRDVDEKASWLARRAVGENYDVSMFQRILAIGITPFHEFLDSLSSYYWLTPRLPRVMTPAELSVALESGDLARIAQEESLTVPIGREHS